MWNKTFTASQLYAKLGFFNPYSIPVRGTLGLSPSTPTDIIWK